MKEIEKIEIQELIDFIEEQYILPIGQLRHVDLITMVKLNELIEVVNSLIKDEEETKPKGKTK